MNVTEVTGPVRRFFIGAATTTYDPGLGLGDRPELADELWRIRELFATLGYTVVPEFGAGLTSQAFQDRLRAFLRDPDRRPADVLVIYYTGHGVNHGGDLLLPMADTTDLSYGSVRAGDLTGRLLDSYEPGEVAGQQLLFILDTCYGGSASKRMGVGAAEFLARLRRLAGAPSVAVIVAARDYETAAAGAFTQALAAAVGDRSVAGYEAPFLPLDALVAAIDARTPPSQHAQLVFMGERASGFFPNVRFENWLGEYDLRTRDLKAQRRARQRERDDHVTPRARGLDKVGGRDDLWLFTGRHAALRELTRWLSGAGPATMVVTGRPGSGKSALLARVDVLADPKRRRWVPNLHMLPPDTIPADHAVSRFVHARGHMPQDLLAALAEAAGISAISTIDSVNALVSSLPRESEPIVVIVDAVDEAVDSRDEQRSDSSPMVEQVLAPLVAAAGRIPLRLLVGTRSHLVAALGQPAQLLDLDDPRFADRAGLNRYARRCLTDLVDNSPYRSQSISYVDRVAAAVASNARDSFLVALITARSLALRPELVANPHDPIWRAQLPRQAAQAMRQDLDQRLGSQAERARDLLLPLAYAEASGLPWEDLWPRLVRALTGRSCTNADLQWLIEQAGYYIVESSLERRSVYRLYHESLAEHLRIGRDTEADQTAIVDTLTERAPRLPDGSIDWAHVHPYTAAAIATHAAGTNRLDALLAQPRFLLETPSAPLAAALPHTRTPHGHAAADAYRRASTRLRAAPHDQRAAYLQLAACCARAPQLARAVGDSGLPLPFRTDWASCRLQQPHHTITGHTGPVLSVAVGQLADRTIVVSGAVDGKVRVWDAATGDQVGDLHTGHRGPVGTVALGQIDGRMVVVSGSRDRTIQIWDATTGTPIGDPLTGHTGSVLSVAVGQLADRTIVVSGSKDRTIQIWDATTGTPIGDPLTGHTDLVLSVAVGQLADRTIVVSGGGDRTVRVWDAAGGTPIGEPLTGHTDWISSVAIGQIDHRTVLVSGSADGAVRVWDAAGGASLGGPFTGHADRVSSVAVGQVDGRTMVVSGSRDRTVRVWDTATGTPIGEPFIGHADWVSSVAVGRVNGRALLVSGSADETIRLWDAATGAPHGHPLTGHTDRVSSVAVGQVDGRTMVVSGSRDRTVRMWDPATGAPHGHPLTGHIGPVKAVAAALLADRTIVVSGSGDQTIRIWDAATGAPLGEPLTGHSGPVNAVATGQVADRTIVVSGSSDRTIRIWDAATGAPLGEPLTGHTDWVSSVALRQLADRTIVVSGSGDRTIRIWDAATGAPLGEPFTGHTGSVLSVAVGQVDGRALVVSGSRDQTVRVWDAGIPRPQGLRFAQTINLTTKINGIAIGLLAIHFATEAGVINIRLQQRMEQP